MAGRWAIGTRRAGYVQFTINVTTVGVQTLDFRYTGITAATRTLIIDATTTTSVAFPATATFWSQWALKIVTTGSLSVGSHTVKLIRSASDVEMINLDRLTVTPPTTGATTTTTVPAGSGVVVSEAEDAVNNLTFDTTTGALGSFGRDR